MICFNDQIWKCLVSYSHCNFKISILWARGAISLATHKSSKVCKCPLVNASVMCLADLTHCCLISKSSLWFKSTGFQYLSASCLHRKTVLFQSSLSLSAVCHLCCLLWPSQHTAPSFLPAGFRCNTLLLTFPGLWFVQVVIAPVCLFFRSGFFPLPNLANSLCWTPSSIHVPHCCAGPGPALLSVSPPNTPLSSSFWGFQDSHLFLFFLQLRRICLWPFLFTFWENYKEVEVN